MNNNKLRLIILKCKPLKTAFIRITAILLFIICGVTECMADVNTSAFLHKKDVIDSSGKIIKEIKDIDAKVDNSTDYYNDNITITGLCKDFSYFHNYTHFMHIMQVYFYFYTYFKIDIA